jgi:hypothetical protein
MPAGAFFDVLRIEPANASDQDRHLMVTSIRSPSLNAVVFVVAARTNTRQLAQILCSSDNLSLDPRFFWPRGDQRKPASMLRPAQLLHLSPRARTHAARSPLKSP